MPAVFPNPNPKAFEYTLSVYAVFCRRSLLQTLYFAYKKNSNALLGSIPPQSERAAARLEDMDLGQLIRHRLWCTVRLLLRQRRQVCETPGLIQHQVREG